MVNSNTSGQRVRLVICSQVGILTSFVMTSKEKLDKQSFEKLTIQHCRRVVCEVLLWRREKMVVWALQQPVACDANDGLQQDTALPHDVEGLLPVHDALFAAIHSRLLWCGTIHPLLVGYYVRALPEPKLDVAKVSAAPNNAQMFFLTLANQWLLQKYGRCGCSFATYCNLWYELSADQPQTSFGERQQKALIECLNARTALH
jgi:hypothetical protein